MRTRTAFESEGLFACCCWSWPTFLAKDTDRWLVVNIVSKIDIIEISNLRYIASSFRYIDRTHFPSNPWHLHIFYAVTERKALTYRLSKSWRFELSLSTSHRLYFSFIDIISTWFFVYRKRIGFTFLLSKILANSIPLDIHRYRWAPWVLPGAPARFCDPNFSLTYEVK